MLNKTINWATGLSINDSRALPSVKGKFESEQDYYVPCGRSFRLDVCEHPLVLAELVHCRLHLEP